MIDFRLGRYASMLYHRAPIIFVIATMLMGCGSQTHSIMPGAAQARASQITLDAVGRNLLYVSNPTDNVGIVYVYTYPHGKQVGALASFEGAYGLCADQSGDIFVPFLGLFGGIYEFAHGGASPIASLSNEYAYEVGCSVSPMTGKLAVIGGYHAAYVTTYNHKVSGWKIGKSYEDRALSQASFCGYDNEGNLFVDGTTSSGDVALTELPSGGNAFTTITLSQSIKAPGGVQWDGSHLAVGDTGTSPSVIYQFDVSGSRATKVGSTMLGGSKRVEQFWIQRGRLVAPDPARSCGQSPAGCIAIYRYPAGGSPITTIVLAGAFGATVSLAPK
jgi:hypothetical protein